MKILKVAWGSLYPIERVIILVIVVIMVFLTGFFWG